MFEHLEEFKEWYNEELYSSLEDRYEEYKVVWKLYNSKIFDVPEREKLPISKLSEKVFRICRDAITRSSELVKVWDYSYEQFEKDAKENDEDASEESYDDYMQMMTYEFMDNDFDPDLKQVMEESGEWEWRDEYEFKAKMKKYLTDANNLEDGFEEETVAINHVSMIEIFL